MPDSPRGPLRRPLFRFHPHTWTLWLMATPLLMGAALFFDFVPIERSFLTPLPDWVPATVKKTDVVYFELGWPIVTAIYLPNGGFHFSPLAGPVFLTQALLYAACTGVVWAWRHTTRDGET